VLSSDWEGIALVMEAMASGLPIVSTRCGRVPTLFERGKEGFIVARGDAQGSPQLHGISVTRPRNPSYPWGGQPHDARSKILTYRLWFQAYERLYEKLVNLPRGSKAEPCLAGKVCRTPNLRTNMIRSCM